MKKLMITLLATAFVLSCAACGSNDEISELKKEVEELKQQLPTTAQTDTSISENEHKKIASSPTKIPENTPPEKKYQFAAGYYEVGIDIPAGRYDIKHVSGQGHCEITEFVGNEKSPNTTMSEYMAAPGDEIPSYFAPALSEFNNMPLSDGDQIKIDSSLTVSFELDA